MGSISIWHWLIVLVVVALVFGTRKLRSAGSDLGGAVKDFRESVRSDGKPLQQDNKNDHIIEGEITRKTHSNI